MEGEVLEMLPSAIPMRPLRRSSSPISSIGFSVKSRRRWHRFRKGIFIVSVVITLSISLATTLIVLLRKAPLSVEYCAEIHMSKWLPWSQRVNDTRVPRILLWSPVEVSSVVEVDASQPIMYFGSSRAFNCISHSGEVVACEVTMQHSRTNDSDALVFYGESITASLLPKCRSSGQMWVFWATADIPPPKSHEKLSQISGLFNWTMGRRNDADVMVAYKTWHCENADRKERNQEKMEAYMQKRKYRRDAAWIVGECERETFINVSRDSMGNFARDHERERAIRIHLLTACGFKQCGSRRNCVRYIAQKYHFIIVSDMPECFQSASEVIYDAFEHNVVPVVLEDEDALQFPPKSVISSSTMRNPGELAAYLRTLIDNPKLYDRYFAWKDKCTVAPPTVDGLCTLCGALHEKPRRERRHSSVLNWWKPHKNCTHSRSSILSKPFFVNE